MRITFKLYKGENWDDPQTREVLVNELVWMRQSEIMEPEDAVFHRELCCPFACRKLIELVIEKVKLGEEIEFVEKEVVYE